MANESIKKGFKDIADAIREKTGKNGTMSVEEMPGEIASIQTGGTGTIDITENGEHDVAQYGVANVNVPIPEGYVKPTGTLFVQNIINPLQVDVTNYKYVNFTQTSWPVLPLVDINEDENDYDFSQSKLIVGEDTYEWSGGQYQHLSMRFKKYATTLPENYSKSDFDSLFSSLDINIDDDNNALLIVLPVYLDINGQALEDFQNEVRLYIEIVEVEWASDWTKVEQCNEFLASTYSGGVVISDLFGKTIKTFDWDDNNFFFTLLSQDS